MKKQRTSDWQELEQSLQAVQEKQVATAEGHQSLLTALALILLGTFGLVFMIYRGLSAPSQSQLSPEHLVADQPAMSSSTVSSTDSFQEEESKLEADLKQAYRAGRADYAFTWDVASVEGLMDRSSRPWDSDAPLTTLDQVISFKGKPNLLDYYDEGWLHVLYTEHYTDIPGDWGSYDQQVSLSFQREGDDWLLVSKSMTYLVSEEIQSLVEAAPHRSRMIEGTNQKARLHDLASPLAVGQVSTGAGGASLAETVHVLGHPLAYGFWSDSDTLLLVYEDFGDLELWFKRQADGSYLLAKKE